jgi:hypothetical protein
MDTSTPLVALGQPKTLGVVTEPFDFNFSSAREELMLRTSCTLFLIVDSFSGLISNFAFNLWCSDCKFMVGLIISHSVKNDLI